MKRDNVIITFVVAVAAAVVGSILYGIISDESTPDLAFVKVECYETCTDLIVQSKSSRPFLIHGYDLLIQKVLRNPPPPVVPAPALPPQPDFRQRERGPIFQWRRAVVGRQVYPTCAPLPIDNIEFSLPDPPQLRTWMIGRQETTQARAYEPARIRVSIVDDARAGRSIPGLHSRELWQKYAPEKTGSSERAGQCGRC